jgi:hypothetical protein
MKKEKNQFLVKIPREGSFLKFWRNDPPGRREVTRV